MYFILNVVTRTLNVQLVLLLARSNLLTIGRRNMFYVVGRFARTRTVVFVVRTV